MSIGAIDFLIVAVIGLVTWCVASEGAFGAGTIFVSVLISGFLAMNFFEPLAGWLDGIGVIGPKADMLALLGLFAVLVTGLRVACEYVSPTYIGLDGIFHDIGRWSFAALTGYVTAGILLTALHTAPLPREFLRFTPKRENLLFNTLSPDRQWLGLMQYLTEKPFAKTDQVPDTLFGEVPVKRIFDGRTAYHWFRGRRGAARVLNDLELTTVTSANAERVVMASTKIVMPSFVVRYADRRSQLYGGPAPETAPERTPAAPTGPRF